MLVVFMRPSILRAQLVYNAARDSSSAAVWADELALPFMNWAHVHVIKHSLHNKVL